MSLFPSSSSPSFIALHKASSNRFCIPLMIHGARSPPISLPARISIPPSFPSLLDVVGTTASSYAIRFQSLEEIPILVSLFSPLVSRTRSQSHPVTCLTALRRQIQTLRLCASRSFSFFSVLLNLFWGAVSQRFWSIECREFLSGNRCYPSPLTFAQTSSTWLLDYRNIHIDSQTRSDGLSDVIVTSGDGRMSLTLNPVCSYTLLYPAAR
jgi:hypothetical protein